MKKFVLSFIALIISVVCTFSLVACSGNDTHTWSEDWSSNDSNHWHDCTDPGCKQRSDITLHTWTLTTVLDNSTCTEEGYGVYTCFICGRTKNDTIEKSGHNWVLIYTEYAANCITDGRGSYRCTDCAVTQDKMVIPATGVHDWATAWSNNDSGHYHVCKVTGCGATDEPINHTESGPIIIEAQDYVDGADETRCTECNYLMSSILRPAKGIPVSFDVKFGSTEPVDGGVVLKSYSPFALTYPNAINAAGNSISALPYYSDSSKVGVVVYVVTDADAEIEREVTASTGDEIGFSINQTTLYSKAAGVYTLVFKFILGNEVKAQTTINVLVTS